MGSEKSTLSVMRLSDLGVVLFLLERFDTVLVSIKVVRKPAPMFRVYFSPCLTRLSNCVARSAIKRENIVWRTPQLCVLSFL